MILQDFQRGRLPYFVPPPKMEGEQEIEKYTIKDKKNVSQTEPVMEPTKIIPSVTQNYKDLTVMPEFDADDCNNDDPCEDEGPNVLNNKEDSDSDIGSDEEEVINAKSFTEHVDNEISFQYFNQARHKANISKVRNNAELSGDGNSSECEDHSEEEAVETEDQCSDEILEAEFVNTLTADERVFLGFAKTSNIDIKGKMLSCTDAMMILGLMT